MQRINVISHHQRADTINSSPVNLRKRMGLPNGNSKQVGFDDTIDKTHEENWDRELPAFSRTEKFKT
jgi:hypothetical protein